MKKNDFTNNSIVRCLKNVHFKHYHLKHFPLHKVPVQLFGEKLGANF